MPPRESSQKMPRNWKATKKNPKASCAIKGSAANRVDGTRKSEAAGETWKSAPSRRAEMKRKKRIRSSLEMRKRVQSDDFRRSFDGRAKMPSDHMRYHLGDRSAMR